MLALAAWIVESRHPASSWPRAAAILLRQHLEAVVADHWQQRGVPGMGEASQRHQLIALPCYCGGAEELAAQIRLTWYQLTRVCHGSAYQVVPTADQLLGWAGVIEQFATASRAMVGGA